MKEFAVLHNHRDKSLIFKVHHNTSLTVFKPLECLNYNISFLCFHVAAVAQNTGNLGMVIEHAYKNAQPVKLISLADLSRLSNSGTKKGLKRIRNRKKCMNALSFKSTFSNSLIPWNKFCCSVSQKNHRSIKKTLAKQKHHV